MALASSARWRINREGTQGLRPPRWRRPQREPLCAPQRHGARDCRSEIGGGAMSYCLKYAATATTSAKNETAAAKMAARAAVPEVLADSTDACDDVSDARVLRSARANCRASVAAFSARSVSSIHSCTAVLDTPSTIVGRIARAQAIPLRSQSARQESRSFCMAPPKQNGIVTRPDDREARR